MSDYQVRTNNNLLGVQLGTRARRCWGRWRVEGTGKAGVFANLANQASPAIFDYPGVVLRPDTNDSTTRTAFVGWLNATAIYQLNSTWGVRAGYNVIWLEGVALAPDQLDFANTPTSGSSIHTAGGVLLHGVNIGLEGRW